MGLALDLSQRLRLRTLLLGDQFVVRPSLMPRLELASCLPMTASALKPGDAQGYEGLLDGFLLAVVDLGVVRLDGRLLALARPTDPVIVVTRYGSTEREELATTAAALKAASRTIAGVIINGVPDLPSPLRGWARVFRGG